MVASIAITNNDIVQLPILADGITLTQQRRGAPATLKFTVIKDATLDIQEGNPVLLQIDGTSVFYGFIFKKGRKGSNARCIEVTAYDQIRYLKSKDEFSYTATADELISMIASRYQLSIGDLAPTGYRISRVESNSTLLDIAETALDETLQNTGKMFVLYDDIGKLTLKNIEDMKLPLLVDKTTAGDFNYETSIDKDTYNQIKVLFDTGTPQNPLVLRDKANVDKWGVLQKTQTVKNGNGAVIAAELLKLYNDKTRTLTLSSVLGDLRVRAGCSIIVKLDLGDILVQNYMLIEQATHKFKDGVHLMDLRVRGGSFIA